MGLERPHNTGLVRQGICVDHLLRFIEAALVIEGFTERDYAAPSFTDSRPRRFLPIFRPRRKVQRIEIRYLQVVGI